MYKVWLKPKINLSFSKIQIANPDNFTWAIFFPTQVKLSEITQFANFKWLYLTHIKSKLAQIFVSIEALDVLFLVKQFHLGINYGEKDMGKSSSNHNICANQDLFVFEQLLTFTQPCNFNNTIDFDMFWY